MAWHETEDVEQYLAAAGDLLFGEPGINTVALTVCENVRARPDGTRFAWWQEPGGDVTGCVSRTPPYPVVLACVPEEAMPGLVDLWPLEAVNGRTAVAAQVAALAARRTGCRARLKGAERLFRLDTLVPPDVPGAARVADEGDVEVLPGDLADPALELAHPPWGEALAHQLPHAGRAAGGCTGHRARQLPPGLTLQDRSCP